MLKIKNISNMHEFFYEQTPFKVGASENNLKLYIKLNKKNYKTKIILQIFQTKILNYQLKNSRYLKNLPKQT